MKRLKSSIPAFLFALATLAGTAPDSHASRMHCTDSSGIGIGGFTDHLNLFLGPAETTTRSSANECALVTLDSAAVQSFEIAGKELKLSAKDPWTDLNLDIQLAPGRQSGSGTMTLRYQEGPLHVAREKVPVKCLFEQI